MICVVNTVVVVDDVVIVVVVTVLFQVQLRLTIDILLQHSPLKAAQTNHVSLSI